MYFVIGVNKRDKTVTLKRMGDGAVFKVTRSDLMVGDQLNHRFERIG